MFSDQVRGLTTELRGIELSLPAAKAALHRGRARLHDLTNAPRPEAQVRGLSPALARYAALFNARDWDGVRAVLVDDVKLDVVSRLKREGRGLVANYFTNYDKVSDWHLVPGWLDGREARGLPRFARRPARLLHRPDPARQSCGRDSRLPLRAVHRTGSGNRARTRAPIMKHVMVRYKVKSDRAVENERYIAKVFEQLARNRPSGLRYASYKLDDGVSFVHIVSREAADDGNPLAELPAFKAFTANIRDRCEEPPIALDLTEVGSYRC